MTVFIVDPDNKLRLMLTHPKSVGRNFDEIVRVVDALQATDKDPIATPADWKPGDRVIVAMAVSTEDAKSKFAPLRSSSPTCASLTPWNVTGPMFHTLHLMFETQYNELGLAVDLTCPDSPRFARGRDVRRGVPRCTPLRPRGERLRQGTTRRRRSGSKSGSARSPLS